MKRDNLGWVPSDEMAPVMHMSRNLTLIKQWAGRQLGVATIFAMISTGPAIEITPTFGSSITGLSYGSDVMVTIRAAIFEYKYRIAETTPVSITFEDMSSGLGQSSTYYSQVPYQDFRAKLAARATTALDNQAVASLPNQAGNPVTGSTNLYLQQAHARAMGYAVSGGLDSTISLNTDITRVGPTWYYPIDGYSLYAVVCHEIDEALGFASELNGLNNGAPAPTGPVYPEDLFRYDQNNNRSWTTAASAEAHLFVPGYGRIEQFNQTQGRDFQDWYGSNTRVQNAQGTQYRDVNLEDAEMNTFDIIGYTVLPKPIWVDMNYGSDISGTGSYYSAMATIGQANEYVGNGGAILVVATGNRTLHTSRLSVTRPCKITPFNGTLRISP